MLIRRRPEEDTLTLTQTVSLDGRLRENRGDAVAAVGRRGSGELLCWNAVAAVGRCHRGRLGRRCRRRVGAGARDMRESGGHGRGHNVDVVARVSVGECQLSTLASAFIDCGRRVGQ